VSDAFNIRGEVNVEVLRVRSSAGEHEAKVLALRVDGRQVPLAAFRQIPCEPIIDRDTGSLKGKPLGWFHYFWGECAGRGGGVRLNVVWIKEGELRRACVDRDPPDQVDVASWNSRYAELGTLPHLFIDL